MTKPISPSPASERTIAVDRDKLLGVDAVAAAVGTKPVAVGAKPDNGPILPPV